MKKQSFVQGALVLAAAMITVRILGAIYKIPLAWMLGPLGLGYYGVPNTYYWMFLLLSTAGIPVAISRLVAHRSAQGHYREAYRVFQIARIALMGTGLFFAVLLYFGADVLVKAGVLDAHSLWGLRALAPIVFTAATVSAYRGFFQGMRSMTSVAISQVVDQLFLVACTLAFAASFHPQAVVLPDLEPTRDVLANASRFFSNSGLLGVVLPAQILQSATNVTQVLVSYREHVLSSAANAGNLGALPGALAGLSCMLIVFWRQKRHIEPLLAADTISKPEPVKSVLKEILAISVPVSIATIALSLANVVDTTLVPSQLRSVGFSDAQALAHYAFIGTYSISFINVVVTLAMAFSESMVPSVSEAFARKQMVRIHQLVDQGLRLVMLIVLPSATGLFLLSTYLTGIIYKVPEAGSALSSMAFMVVFSATYWVTASAMQGLGKVIYPVRNLFIGLLIKVGLTYVLTATALHEQGAGIATTMAFATAAILNIIVFIRLVGYRFRPGYLFGRTFMVNLVMAVVIYGVIRITNHRDPKVVLVASVIAGGGVYGLGILFFGGLSAQELRAFPKIGKPLASLLLRRGLIRESNGTEVDNED